MSDMQCQKCGMIFESGKAYGYACQHRPNCGPMITKSMAASWGGFGLPAVQPTLPPTIALLQKWRDQDHYDTLTLSRDDMILLIEEFRALPAVQPHVNETPKSEHDAANVLTPATEGGWQPIETAPKRRVIDLWSVEGGRYPDAVWGVCGDTEGWTDANDHRSLEGGAFTHWRDRPAPPATKGGDA